MVVLGLESVITGLRLELLVVVEVLQLIVLGGGCHYWGDAAICVSYKNGIRASLLVG